jgi:hypothetical protein
METSSVLTTLKRTTILGILLLSPVFAKAQTADSPAITDLLQGIEATRRARPPGCRDTGDLHPFDDAMAVSCQSPDSHEGTCQRPDQGL